MKSLIIIVMCSGSIAEAAARRCARRGSEPHVILTVVVSDISGSQ
jgi:hypothetical protein